MLYAYCPRCRKVTPHRELVQYVKLGNAIVRETYLQCLICSKYRKVREKTIEILGVET